MKIALLGAENDVLSLLAAIHTSADHDLVMAVDVDLADLDTSLHRDFNQVLGSAERNEGWESLLLGSLADAVIVCRDVKAPDLRAEQLRKLVQEAIPIIVVHPVGEAVLAFELEMIRAEVGGSIVPYQPEIDHPVMTAILNDSRGGNRSAREDGVTDTANHVDQLSIERSLTDHSGEAIRQQFARDALFVRRLIGRIEQISALASSQDRADYNGLSVQMSDEHHAVARWALLPASEDSSRWSVHKDGDEMTVETTAVPDQWRISTDGRVRATAAESAQRFLNRFSDEFGRISNEDHSSNPTWEDACRSIELIENIDISRRRNKTVSLYYEEISEENTFKSLMAASGCFLLILVTLLLPTVAVIESLVGSAVDSSVVRAIDGDDRNVDGLVESTTDSVRRLQPAGASPFLTSQPTGRRGRGWLGRWPVLLLLVLVSFIGLQFLRMVTRSAVREVGADPSSLPPG